MSWSELAIRGGRSENFQKLGAPGGGRKMDMTVQLFWSFRSPYSYLILPRILELRDNYRVTIDMRIVHPAAIRDPAYFSRMDSLARPYFLRDSIRVAEFHGMKFRRPVPDPIDQDPVTLKIAIEQPLARRLGRLGIAATERGRAIDFCNEVAKVLWSGEVTGWDQGAHLSNAALLAGLDLSDLQSAIEADPDKYERMLAENDLSLRAAGHWGGPTMVFEGEPFFGQDRFEVLVWRMKQRGLKSRTDR